MNREATNMDPRLHWEKVYREKNPTEVSWFQADARISRELIELASPDRSAAIFDVGGGASTLVDGLLAGGYTHVTVLDVSGAALEIARKRLGTAAARVTWIEADILRADLAPQSVDVWHDRAVFHFLTDAVDRARYIAQVRSVLRPGGHVLMATFAEDGPTRCSGLDVVRYSPAQLQGELGDDFNMVESRREEHRTPSGAVQLFTWCLSRY
jgi:SAM-dependent methyltransferase